MHCIPNLRGLATALFSLLPLASPLSGIAATAPARAAQNQVAADYGKIPLSFEPNQGQSDPRVQFLSRGSGYSLYLTPGEVVFRLEKQGGSRSLLQGQQPQSAPKDTLRMKMIGANTSAVVSGAEPQSGVVNYLIGSDAKKWHSGIPTFGKVNYAQIYPGVDLIFYGNQRQLEYDFVVAPGADASKVAWQIDGASAAVDKDGNLVLTAAHGPASFKAPVVYQTDGAKRIPIEGAFTVAGNQIRFKLGAYDHSKPLVIDPVLMYATYLGSPVNQFSSTDGESQIGWNLNFSASGFSSPTQGLGVDSQGDVYVTGYTNSTDFPLQNPYQSAVPGPSADSRSFAVFVTKFNPQGTGLIYSTYLGGIALSSQSFGTSIAVDPTGNAYVAGYTDDGSFPVTSGAYQTLCGANWNGSTRINGCGFEGPVGAFVSKLDPTGQTLIYSTFLGGQIGSEIYSIAVDAQGQAYVTGNSGDYCAPSQPAYACFPTTANAILPGTASYVWQPSLGDYGLYTGNAFVTVFDAAGANLLYSSYIGDNTALITSGAVPPGYWGLTNGNAVTVDSLGDFFVTGDTLAPDLPITAGALQSAPSWLPGACCQAFVAKFAPVTSGSSLDYLTYFGGPGSGYGTFATSLAADSEGELYIAGVSHDQDFPTTSGAFQTTCGNVGDENCGIAFVTKLNAAGNGLVWSTMLGNEPGGSGSTVATVGPIQLDSLGDVYIIGTTQGYYPDFPQVNPIQAVTGGNFLPFITEFDPTGSQVLFSTFFGSGGLIGEQYAAGLAVDVSGNMYMAGNAYTTGVATTPGAFQTNFLGTYDGYVAKISPLFPSTTTLSLSPNPSIVGQQVTFTATVAATTVAATPAGTVQFSIDGSPAGAPVALSGGIAVYATNTLDPGTHSIAAAYTPSTGGSIAFLASSSAVLGQVVNLPPAPVAWATPAAITYGTKLSATQLDANSTVAGSSVYSPGLGTVLGAGMQTLSVTFTPANTATYATTTVTQTLQVKPAKLTITANKAAMTYGAALPSFTYTARGFVNGDTPAKALTGTPSFTTPATPASPVGAYPIMIAAGTLAAANYTFSFANGTLTIEKASLTATAANQSMAYGSAVPTLAYTLTGFKNSDTQLSATSGAPVLSTIATSASAPGKYPITIALGKLAATNYSFTLKNGTMTVTKAAQTIAFTPPPTPGVYGVLPVNLVATATSGLAVKFSVQSGPGKVVGSTLTITGAGTLVVAANQAGNSDYTAAPTITQSIVVNQATPSIGLKSSANPVALGKSVTFTATLTGAGVKPTGKVTFLDGATTLGTGTLNASGVATYTTSALAVGPHSITASYPGDSNYVAVTSAAISEAVK